MTEETKTPVSLKSLLTPSKTVEFDYPGMDGFKVKLCYLSREELVKLRSRCVSQKFNKKTRGFEDDVGSRSGELPFSQENVEVLMQNSVDFDQWVTETVGELENFTKSK